MRGLEEASPGVLSSRADQDPFGQAMRWVGAEAPRLRAANPPRAADVAQLRTRFQQAVPRGNLKKLRDALHLVMALRAALVALWLLLSRLGR